MRRLLGNARCVLFDFDGPVCRLFADRPAHSLAQRLRDLADELGSPRLLTPALRTTADPQQVLRGVAARRPAPAVLDRLENTLAQEEITAAGTARPTPYAAPLIAALTTRGHQVAIVTDSSPLAVGSYLQRHRLSGYVGGRVHGRTRETPLLKPHPDCLLRALASTGTRAGQALMIGDSPSDLEAARAAGVPFLGYARGTGEERELREAGAEKVVGSLEPVLTALIAAAPG